MIDHIAALIFNEEGKLLVLRKKTITNRKECILCRMWNEDRKKRKYRRKRNDFF